MSAVDLVVSVNDGLRSLSDAINGPGTDSTSTKGCFGELATVCERVRADDNFVKLVEELRPGDVVSRKAGPPAADKPDAKLTSSLDVVFGTMTALSAPITDICMVYKGDSVPDGFTKVSFSVGGNDADMNKGSGGRSLYLCVARKPMAAPVTALAVVFGVSGEFFPPGFQPVKHHASNQPGNFNSGTAGHEICIGLFRGQGSPIVDLGIWFPDRNIKHGTVLEKVPAGHYIMKRTVLGHVANLNSSTRGHPLFLTVRKDLSHVYSLFTGWKGLAAADARRGSVTAAIPTDVDSGRFGAPTVSEVDLDSIDVAPVGPDGNPGGPEADVAPAPEEAGGGTFAQDVETDWTEQAEYRPSAGKFAWIFPDSEALSGSPSAQSAVLATLIIGLYHTRSSVVAASLTQLELLVRHGWFNNENWKAASTSASSREDLRDYGSLLLELVIASAGDAVSTRPDLLHRELAALISTFVRMHGQEATGGRFGMRPLSLYRCLEVMLRMYFFFSRKKLYSGRLARWAQASGRDKDTEGLQRNFESARRDAVHSRTNLSELLKCLINAVEVEFGPLLPPDPAARDDRSTLFALVGPFKSLVRAFRTSDSASPMFCTRLHRAATRVFACWAREMVDRGVTGLGKYLEGPHQGMRSCAVDVLVTLGIICKIASLPLQVDAEGNPRSVSDLQTKVAVLQLCGESVASAGELFKNMSPLSYFIRRVVSPAVLVNCADARIMLPSVFKAVLGCITSMWMHYRQSLKPELGVLAHIIMLRTLTSPQSLPQQKSDVLAELRSWIQVPQDLVEMYLNFDNDAPYNHMRLLYHLFRALTDIACGSLNSVRIESSSSSDNHEEQYMAAALALQRDAIDMLASILRSVMDAAATVHLIAMDAKTRKLSEAGWQWDGTGDRSLDSPQPHPSLARNSSVRERFLSKKQLDEVLEEGIALCNSKSIAKGLKKLVADGYLTDSPDDVVAFLRLCGDRLEAREIGDFLGDIGRGAEEEAWYHRIREVYMAGLDFTGMPFDVAFRHLLTNGGFFLPGEAQKIDRITSAFAKAYFEGTAVDEGEDEPVDVTVDPKLYRLSSTDVAEVLTFSLIMLHTDAHNPNIKKEKKMTMQQFVNNNRGIDGGKNLPKEFLEYLYTSTVTHEIKILPGASSAPAEGGKTPAHSYVGEITTSIHRALAHLCSLAKVNSVHRKNFSRDVVGCMLEDIWPDVMRLMQHLLIDRKDAVATEPPIAAISLNIVKYASSASLFLGLASQVKDSGVVLESLESRIMGVVSQPWQKALVAPSETGIDPIVSMLHLRMAEISETAADDSDKQNLAETAGRFKQPFRDELKSVPSRRVLYEGFLTKVCSNGRGKHKRYKFFLFTDLLVYASTGAFSSMFTMHGCIALETVVFVDSPVELSTIPHSFKLNTDVKSVYLFADSEEEHMAWRRRIREAVRILRVAANNARSDGSEQADAPIAAADEDTGVSSGGQADVMEDTSTYSFRPSVGGPVPPTAGEPSSALSAKPQSPSTAAAAAGGGALPSLPPGVSSRVRSMSSKELKEVFKAALEYSRPLLQAPSAPAPPSSAPAGTPADARPVLTDLQKLQFYGYFKQATKGDAGDTVEEAGGPVEAAKAEAWRKCRSLSRKDAMRAFVYLMYQVSPGWDNRSTLEVVPESPAEQ